MPTKMNSLEKVKRRNLYPEQQRGQAAERRARQLTRYDLPSRMNSPDKVRRRNRSKPSSNALGTNRLSRQLSPV